jgi:hypothetical protein
MSLAVRGAAARVSIAAIALMLFSFEGADDAHCPPGLLFHSSP